MAKMSNIFESVQGSRLDGLIALRDKISQELDESNSGRDIASLSRQLRETLKEIEEIKAASVSSENEPPKTALEIIRMKHDRITGTEG